MADVGNKAYRDKGQLLKPGDTSDFPEPEGIKRFEGYGADEADLERGYVEPEISDRPQYDLAAYKERWSEPKAETTGAFPYRPGLAPDDLEFLEKNRQTKGFLIRPRIPTDR
ncbi:MAG TPA: hypothetical protein VJQ82_08765 [Terriglobales bacterium]|nr:hypothetical protein [Terriglobales bacterium]